MLDALEGAHRVDQGERKEQQGGFQPAGLRNTGRSPPGGQLHPQAGQQHDGDESGRDAQDGEQEILLGKEVALLLKGLAVFLLGPPPGDIRSWRRHSPSAYRGYRRSSPAPADKRGPGRAPRAARPAPERSRRRRTSWLASWRREVKPGRLEHLDVLLAGVQHVEPPLPVHGDGGDEVEIPGGFALAAEDGQQVAVHVVLVDPGVVFLGHCDGLAGVHGDVRENRLHRQAGVGVDLPLAIAAGGENVIADAVDDPDVVLAAGADGVNAAVLVVDVLEGDGSGLRSRFFCSSVANI